MPSGLALAAVAVDRYFSAAEDDYPGIDYTKIIRVAAKPGAVPPVFIVAGVE